MEVTGKSQYYQEAAARIESPLGVEDNIEKEPKK
jgi:hypothetical protein